MTTEQQNRANALEELQYTKERYGPSYEACMKQAEYRYAAWKVVELNTLLIHWVLRPHDRNQDYDDLVGELSMTMFRCCYLWEPLQGKFSTYAVACMRPATLKHLTELRQLYLPVKLPSHLRTEGNRAAYMQKLYGEATVLQESYTTAEEDEELHLWWRRADKFKKRLDAVEKAKGFNQGRTSHTRRFYDGDGVVYGEAAEVELIVDEEAISTEDAVSMGWGLRAEVKSVLESLTEREQLVLNLRFGLDDDDRESKTLERTGQELGVSRERIRQIEAKALRKLRHPKRSKRLRDFLD